MGYQIEYAYTCHIGRVRINNEDNFWCCGDSLEADNLGTEVVLEGSEHQSEVPLLAVFDGMGGESCGEMAAYLASDACGRYYRDQKKNLQKKPESFFVNICRKMNDAVCTYSKENKINSMGATAAMLGFSKDAAYACNLGDSRIYQWENGELTQLSTDHVFSRGTFGKPPLTQFIGIPEEQMVLEPEIVKSELKEGIRYLICSDGLTDMVRHKEICEILSEKQSLKHSVEILVEKALAAGGRDNITVLLCEANETGKNSRLKRWLKGLIMKQERTVS